MPNPNPNNLATRERLLRAGLETFGHRDYDAVSTRDIVDRAEANIAAISYHFGGKWGLYMATAEFLSDNLARNMQPRFDKARSVVASGDPVACRTVLKNFISDFAANLLLGEFGEHGPGFIFREQNHPTEAFDILYQRLFTPLYETVTGLVACIRGLDPEYPEAKLVAHALIGQVISFRVGRATVMRRLNIDGYDEEDARLIGHLISALADSALNYSLSGTHS